MACFLQEGHTNESNNIRMRGMKLCIIDDDLRKLIWLVPTKYIYFFVAYQLRVLPLMVFDL